jgi:hypothetical protein
MGQSDPSVEQTSAKAWPSTGYSEDCVSQRCTVSGELGTRLHALSSAIARAIQGDSFFHGHALPQIVEKVQKENDGVVRLGRFSSTEIVQI